MNLTAEQLQIAATIDARNRDLPDSATDETTILTEMVDYMPGFKRLLDTSSEGELDELCARFPGFYRYAKILERLAAGIQSGEIKVP